MRAINKDALLEWCELGFPGKPEIYRSLISTIKSGRFDLPPQDGGDMELLETARYLLDQTDNSDFFDPSCSECEFSCVGSKDYSKLLDAGQETKLCEWHTDYVKWLKKMECFGAKP